MWQITVGRTCDSEPALDYDNVSRVYLESGDRQILHRVPIDPGGITASVTILAMFGAAYEFVCPRGGGWRIPRTSVGSVGNVVRQDGQRYRVGGFAGPGHCADQLPSDEGAHNGLTGKLRHAT